MSAIRRALMANNSDVIPEVGDIVIVDGGKKKYIKRDDYVAATMASKLAGVVYDIDLTNRICRIVGNGNTTSKQWSCVADYQIKSIPSSSGNYAVKLNSVAQGDFSYTKTDGSIKDYCSQLEAWLRTCASTSKAAKWECYYDDSKGKGFLQQFNYDEYESTNSIASTGLTKLVGSELSPYTTSAMYNMIGQNIYLCGMNRQRIEEYSTSSGETPSSAIDGTTKLYNSKPVNKAAFESNSNCAALREKYATYSDYIDACMIDIECNKGILAGDCKNGQLMTSKLLQKTVKVQGSAYKCPYTAAQYANDYATNAVGFGAGSWWLPSMYELCKLMRDVRYNSSTKKYEDNVNKSLSVCGYSNITYNSFRWSSSRYSTNAAWLFNSYGYSNYSNFSNGFAVSVVSAYQF